MKGRKSGVVTFAIEEAVVGIFHPLGLINWSQTSVPLIAVTTRTVASGDHCASLLCAEDVDGNDLNLGRDLGVAIVIRRNTSKKRARVHISDRCMR